MNSRGLDRPIVLIGAARSGTTLLGDLVARHPEVAYWLEPKYVWRYRAAFRSSDVRGAGDATPGVVRYIRGRFSDFVRERGKSRFAEKTPSNCFRIPFIDEVLPDALYVHVIRDGRDVALSARRAWTSVPERSVIRRRILQGDIPPREAPSYLVPALRNLVARWISPSAGYLWGPHFPGMSRFRREHGVLATCARQWLESVSAAREGLSLVPSSRVREIRYEDLVEDPRGRMAEVWAHLGLSEPPGFGGILEEVVRGDRVAAWKSADPEEVGEIEAEVGPLLEELGYAPPRGSGRPPSPRTP